MPLVPACLDQNWEANRREALRELLLTIALSKLAVITVPKKPDKVHKLRVNHVLYQISNPARARELARVIIDGGTLPPIEVQEFRFQHLLYYIPVDGNHRTGAACYLMENVIKAKIVSSTDVTGIPFILGPGKRVMVGTGHNKRWKLTDHAIVTGTQAANFATMSHLQEYDHIRKQEIAHG